ncbi:MAG: histidine--tRNA ligase [Planctomycetota bacterium]
MPRLRAARGTEDLLPDRIPAIDHVFGHFRRTAEACGFGEIRTPMFEDTSLFVRSLGDESDVVQKEMFTVVRGDTSVTFRPEGTAPVVRAYLEHNLDKIRPFQKFFYAGPMYRFERPQAGRQRQFYQCGIEALGSDSPLLDAEVIGVAMRSLEAMGLKNFELRINSIGDSADRDVFREVLKDYMRPLLEERCDDCKRRFERNVFRMLDCKVEGCQPSNKAAPQFLEHLRPESRERFDRTLEALAVLSIEAKIDPSIVRGFDYYTHAVYEIICPDLGARSAVCGGGRYDTLIPDTGGPEIGATGFAIGVTPVLLALEKQGHPAVQPSTEGVNVYIAPVTDDQRLPAFEWTDRLRKAGLSADTDHEQKSLKAQMKGADKRGARFAIVLGPGELESGNAKVKDLRQGEEFEVALDESLAPTLLQRLDAPSSD